MNSASEEEDEDYVPECRAILRLLDIAIMLERLTLYVV